MKNPHVTVSMDAAHEHVVLANRGKELTTDQHIALAQALAIMALATAVDGLAPDPETSS